MANDIEETPHGLRIIRKAGPYWIVEGFGPILRDAKGILFFGFLKTEAPNAEQQQDIDNFIKRVQTQESIPQ